MAYEWLVGGTLLGRKHRGGGKGDREAQTQRQVEKRRLAREAARLAAGKPKSKGGQQQGPQKGRCSKSTGVLPAKRPQCQKAAWMMRRRLRGKQTPMGVTAFARTAHAMVKHAEAVLADSVARERAAVAAAQAAKQGASVALEREKAAHARTADALNYADRVWEFAGRGGPPFFG